MLEVHAGTTDAGFRADVEAEQHMQCGELLRALATDHEYSLCGPAATEAAVRLVGMRERTGCLGRTARR
jgi:hypothetical protein